MTKKTRHVGQSEKEPRLMVLARAYRKGLESVLIIAETKN